MGWQFLNQALAYDSLLSSFQSPSLLPAANWRAALFAVCPFMGCAVRRTCHVVAGQWYAAVVSVLGPFGLFGLMLG
jgi:hypothetical protein